jgi:hypothetical protein
MQEYSLLQVLGLNVNSYDPRFQRIYKLFYSKLPIGAQEFESKIHLILHLMNDKFQPTVPGKMRFDCCKTFHFSLQEMSVFIEKSATIGDIIEQAKKEFKFSEDGSGVLR